MTPPRKVALVRASRIGDFVCATPAFRSLRAALPEAEMVLIGLPFVRELVDRCPSLDRFVPFPGYPGMAEQFFDARQVTTFFEDMQAEHFDLAIQMHGSGVFSNPFALMLGARWTVGFIRAGDPSGRLDAALPMPETGHEIERLLALAVFLGAPMSGTQPDFGLWPEDLAKADALLAGVAGPLIGLHPAAREATKRWPAERFASVAAELQQRHGGTIVLLGGPDERALAGMVAARLTGPYLNLAGETSLPVAGAVIQRLALLLTNDSGPAHIAYALGTPAVTVFGATDPRRWGPPKDERFRVMRHEVPCHPCDYWVCPIGTRCLRDLPESDVFGAAEQALFGPWRRAGL